MKTPNQPKCPWCEGTMEKRGISRLGSGLNYFSMWCTKCNAVAFHVNPGTKKIESIDHEIHYKEENTNG